MNTSQEKKETFTLFWVILKEDSGIYTTFQLQQFQEMDAHFA